MSRKRTPLGYRRMLTTANHKTSKGESLGYFTAILYLSPSDESGIIDTCPKATAGCREACLGKHAGRNVMPANFASRIWKTTMLVENRALFLDCIRWDIGKLVRRVATLGYCPHCMEVQNRRKGRNANRCRNRHCKGALVAVQPAVRINGSSDLPWIALLLASEFPSVQFYDYTKLPKPHLRTRPNYSITFSYSGENLRDSLNALSNGVNVAVVFNTRKGAALPSQWNGFQVIDGDLHDLRFLDQSGVVIGLRAKGRAMKQDSCFIVKSELVQIAASAHGLPRGIPRTLRTSGVTVHNLVQIGAN